MSSVGAICFEDRFYVRKKRGIGTDERISAWGAMHMAATLAGYRTALLALAGPFFTLLANTNGVSNHSSPLVGAPFLDL